MLPIRNVVVLGGGSAGWLSALALRVTMPDLAVTLVQSRKIPVIGVGESTTVAIPRFLHDMLRLPRGEFYAQVRPSWKLGVRFEWGDPNDSHFNYTFDPCVDIHSHPFARGNGYFCLSDLTDASRYYAMMDAARAPCIGRENGSFTLDPGAAYHIENKPFIGYLEQQAKARGVTTIEGEVTHVERNDAGWVTSLELDDGRSVSGELFVDCSGFRSELLSKTMSVPYVSYADSLFCDAAVIGSWQRTHEPLLPYTTAETMDHGWCWQIEFERHVTRGYVYSTQFCTADQASEELRRKNPALADADLREVRFPSGRYQRFWEKNVVAVGNASGFVEPLEATALHLIVEQLRLLRQGVNEGARQCQQPIIDLQNQRFAEYWDDVRDFLAIHYAFNRRLDTPFWRHCRAETNIAGAAPLVELYREIGPSSLCGSVIFPRSIFGFNGYLTMLIGQRVPTRCQFQPSPEEQKRWDQHRLQVRAAVRQTTTMDHAMQLVHSPQWNWHNA